MVRWVYLSGYIASLIWSWTLLDLAHLMSYERLVFSALTSDPVSHIYAVHAVCYFVCGYFESWANLHCQSCTDKRTQELQSGDANSFQRCKPRLCCNQSNSSITILTDMTCVECSCICAFGGVGECMDAQLYHFSPRNTSGLSPNPFLPMMFWQQIIPCPCFQPFFFY